MAKLPTSFQLLTLHWQGLDQMARLRLSCRKGFHLKGRYREWLLGKISNIHHQYREMLYNTGRDVKRSQWSLIIEQFKVLVYI